MKTPTSTDELTDDSVEYSWLGIDAYQTRDGRVETVEAIWGDTEARAFTEIILPFEDRVPTTDVDEAAWDHVGVAAIKDHDSDKQFPEVETLYAVFAAPDHSAWGTVAITEDDKVPSAGETP